MLILALHLQIILKILYKLMSTACNLMFMYGCIVPYFGDCKMNEITASDIIQWQNEMLQMNFSDSYLRMLQNQMTASVSREDLALSMVEITVDTSSVSASVQAMILREYKSIMQLRYTKPSVVQM